MSQLLLAALPPAATVLTHRADEVPYGMPSGFEVARTPLGQPVDFAALDPARSYVWVLDEPGTMHVAPEHQPGFGVTRATPGGRTVKHGDLTPGMGGAQRGAARLGGELTALRRPDGALREAVDGATLWSMNSASSYVFNRRGPGGAKEPKLGAPAMQALGRLLEGTGSDLAHVRIETHTGTTVFRSATSLDAVDEVRRGVSLLARLRLRP